MPNYALYHKTRQVFLEHPLVGLWYATEFSEAQSMLSACHEYMRAVGLHSDIENVVVVDHSTGDEV